MKNFTLALQEVPRMRNIVRMDVYRVFRNKMTYILLGATVLLNIVVMGSFAMLELSLRYIDFEALGAETVALLETTLPKDFGGYIEYFFCGNLLIVFLTVFALVFCSSEYQTGYIKNTAVNILPRHLTVFSKLIVVAVYTVITYLITGLIVVIGCYLLGFTKIDNLGKIIRMILLQILCNYSLTTFFMMIFYITRKNVIAMVTGLIYGTMGNLAYALIALLVSVAFPNSDFDLTKYTNLGNIIFHMNTSATVNDCIRAAIVAVIFIGISTFFSCVSINKKDIK